MVKTLKDVDLKRIEVLDDLEETLKGKHFNYRWLAIIPLALVGASCTFVFLRRRIKGSK